MAKHGYTINPDGTWRPVTDAEWKARTDACEMVDYLRKVAENQTGERKAETMRNIRKIIEGMVC